MTIQRVLELAMEGAEDLRAMNMGNPDGSEHVYAQELKELEGIYEVLSLRTKQRDFLKTIRIGCKPRVQKWAKV